MTLTIGAAMTLLGVCGASVKPKVTNGVTTVTSNGNGNAVASITSIALKGLLADNVVTAADVTSSPTEPIVEIVLTEGSYQSLEFALAANADACESATYSSSQPLTLADMPNDGVYVVCSRLIVDYNSRFGLMLGIDLRRLSKQLTLSKKITVPPSITAVTASSAGPLVTDKHHWKRRRE